MTFVYDWKRSFRVIADLENEAINIQKYGASIH